MIIGHFLMVWESEEPYNLRKQTSEVGYRTRIIGSILSICETMTQSIQHQQIGCQEPSSTVGQVCSGGFNSLRLMSGFHRGAQSTYDKSPSSCPKFNKAAPPSCILFLSRTCQETCRHQRDAHTHVIIPHVMKRTFSQVLCFHVLSLPHRAFI